MKKLHRTLFVASLVPAAIVASSCAGIDGSQQAASGAKAARWSDPATWPNRKVPAAGEKVVIAKGQEVVLDVSTPALHGLSIDGKLTFAEDKDVELTTEWIMLHGELQIGTASRPHTRQATITFTDNVKGEDVMAGMGDRGIMISGGTLNLHGDRTHTWTKLAKTAEKGSTSIEVLDASQWRVGDQIVLASTDFNPRQAEKRTITRISGNTIAFEQPLQYMHFGKITFGVDQRGEVANLTRNIKIRASEDAEQSFFGGHIMAMPSSKMFVSGVELHRMGQNLTLARYPIHWHLVGDAQGQYIKNAAIHDTYNRCVTVHGTNYLQVHNNVTYNTVGHCFFLEDGIEHGNEYVENVAIQTKCHTSKPCVPTVLAASGESIGRDPQGARASGQQSKDVLLPSDNTVSSFWITNPDNIYRGNVAAGSDMMGFWMSLPEHPNGQFEGTEISKNTWPRRTPFREFRGNVAHSNYDSFMFDRHINANNTFSVTGDSHWARENPADPNSKEVETIVADLTSYKNRNGAIWGRGEYHTFTGLKLADNAIGYTHAAGFGTGLPFTSKVVNSLFVGESENIGNPETPAEKAYGRSLPKPELPDFPIRGYEYYDRRHDVEDTTFVNFQDNATRKTGAMSFLLYTSFAATAHNSVERVKFVNAKPVYFPPMERKWANDNGSSVAYKTAVIRDKDGSLGGPAGSSVLIHVDGVSDEIAGDAQSCAHKADWNAVLCQGDIGRLTVGGPGGAGGGFGPRVGGAPGAGPGAGFGAGPGAGPGGPGAAAGRAGPAGAPGAGAPGAPGARPAPAPQPPVFLSRKGNDKRYELTATNVRAGTEIVVTTERPAISLSLMEMDTGSWVMFELPGFKSAASGTAVNSLDALRKASATSYYKAKDGLWVKVVATPDGGRAGGGSIQVSR